MGVGAWVVVVGSKWIGWLWTTQSGTARRLIGGSGQSKLASLSPSGQQGRVKSSSDVALDIDVNAVDIEGGTEARSAGGMNRV